MDKLWRARSRRGIETIEKSDAKFYIIAPETGKPGQHYGGHEDTLDRLDRVLDSHQVTEKSELPSPFHSGEFNPRIWRGTESPSPEEAGVTAEWVYSVRASRAHASRLREILGHVEADAAHNGVYGHEIRDLLILATTEVESAWKAVLSANGVAPIGDQDRWTTRDYCKLIGPMHLQDWHVRLSANPEYPPIQPFGGWNATAPTQSLSWYDAYNRVKHNREGAFQHAQLGHAIKAVAAVFTMVVAQFGTSHLDQQSVFHADEFRVVAEPRWPVNETYIRPLRSHLQDARGAGREWLGHATWTPINCAF